MSSPETAPQPDRRLLHEELFYLIHELSRLATTQFDRMIAPLGMTKAQWWAMMHVYKREGATQSELASIMQMGRASTGKTLERLESNGWIERRADPKDTRVRRIYLASGAMAYFERINAEAGVLYAQHMEGIGEAEQRTLVSGLSKMRANAERKHRKPSRVSLPRKPRPPRPAPGQAPRDRRA